MAFNYKRKYALEAKAKRELIAYNPHIAEFSGIYQFYREDIDNGHCVYIGQAKHLLTRLAEHLTARILNKGECSHIDNSLYNRGLYNEENKDGWKIKFDYYDISKLDEIERNEIAEAQAKGYYLYNITNGGQNAGKYDINERRQTKLKRYKHGKEQGYQKAQAEVRNYFDKYLDYTIKGKPNKIKEKKLQQFKEWLEAEEENKGN